MLQHDMLLCIIWYLFVQELYFIVQGLYIIMQGWYLIVQGWYSDVQGLYLNVQGWYIIVQGLYFDVQGLYLNVQGWYLTVQGLYWNVQGSYVTVQGLYIIMQGVYLYFIQWKYYTLLWYSNVYSNFKTLYCNNVICMHQYKIKYKLYHVCKEYNVNMNGISSFWCLMVLTFWIKMKMVHWQHFQFELMSSCA